MITLIKLISTVFIVWLDVSVPRFPLIRDFLWDLAEFVYRATENV